MCLQSADRDEIAFVNSTTQGIGLIAEGFPWRDGDSVVIPAEEYPSNIYPWMNLASRGVSVRLVPSRAGRIWPEDLIPDDLWYGKIDDAVFLTILAFLAGRVTKRTPGLRELPGVVKRAFARRLRMAS